MSVPKPRAQVTAPAAPSVDAIEATPTAPPSSRGAYLIAVAGLVLLALLIATNMNC